MSSPGSIFISYRRSDSIANTGRIYDYLERRFGRDRVFKDVDSIPLGVNFRTFLDQEVGHCNVLIAVIGPDWLTVTDDGGNRRLDSSTDWVRLEIEAALRRGIPVIPVLVDGARMPQAEDLSGALKALPNWQSARIRHDPDFRRDVDKLIQSLEPLLNGKAKERQTHQAEPPVRRSTDASRPSRNSMNFRFLSVKAPSFLTRRRLLYIASVSGAGVGAVFLGRTVFQSLDSVTANLFKVEPIDPSLPALEPETTVGTTLEFNVVTVDRQGRPTNVQRRQAELRTEVLGNGIHLDMVQIPSGRFTMGSPGNEPERFDNEGPQHKVTVPPFFMGRYPVTQAQWQAVTALPQVSRELNPDPSNFKGENRPVEGVTWHDAVEFCDRLA